MKVLFPFLSTILCMLSNVACDNAYQTQQAERQIRDSIAQSQLRLQQISDSLKRNKEIIRDSLRSQDGDKVLGNIKFGMSRSQFEVSKAEFLRSIYGTGLVHNIFWTDPTSSPPKDYYIGSYNVVSMIPMYHNGKLYEVQVRGKMLQYQRAELEAKSLIKTIENKYGSPDDLFFVEPYRVDMLLPFHTLASWRLPKKTIKVILERDVNYKRRLESYRIQLIISDSILKKAAHEVQREQEQKSRVNPTDIF